MSKEKYKCIKQCSQTQWPLSYISLGDIILANKPYSDDIIEGDDYEVFNLNGYYLFTLDSDEFEEHFISLEELRNEQINEILK